MTEPQQVAPAAGAVDFKTAAAAILLVNETLEWLLAEAQWERDEVRAAVGLTKDLTDKALTADPTTTLAEHHVEVRALAGSTSPRQFRAVCLGCEWAQDERTDRLAAVRLGSAHLLAMLSAAGWTTIRDDVLDQAKALFAEQDREHRWNHSLEESDVRCDCCNLRYGERDQYTCCSQYGIHDHAHRYPEDELGSARACDADCPPWSPFADCSSST